MISGIINNAIQIDQTSNVLKVLVELDEHYTILTLFTVDNKLWLIIKAEM